MTITSHVTNQLFDTNDTTNESRSIRIPPSVVPTHSIDDDLPATQTRGMLWTAKEHEKFLDALEKYPKGPWKVIADLVGTRNTRQVMSHAQKYRMKIARRSRDAAKQKAAQRKEQEQRENARGTVPATIEEQLRTAVVIMNTSNSSVRAPVTSRSELPPLEEVSVFRDSRVPQVPSTQAYVPAASFVSGYHTNVTAFNTAHGLLSQTRHHFHQLTEVTPDMNDTEDLMDWWWRYFLTLDPERVTESAAATIGRGIEYAGRRVQDKLSETDEVRLNSYALSPQSVRDVPAQLNANAAVSVFGNGPGGCVVHHL